jgi:hypothetical protein
MKKKTDREGGEARPGRPTYGVRWAGGPPALASSTARADEVFLVEQEFDY